MSLLATLLVLYALTAIADVYTTKRAILDDYHGWRLGIWEKNPLLRRLWGLLGINAQNAFRPGTDPEGLLAMAVHKVAIGAFTWPLGLWSPPAALAFLGVVSALQLAAAVANRRLLHSKRKLVDSKRRA